MACNVGVDGVRGIMLVGGNRGERCGIEGKRRKWVINLKVE